MPKKILYFDMDGVLFDIKSGLRRLGLPEGGFPGSELIHFGSEAFGDWPAVTDYLRGRA